MSREYKWEFKPPTDSHAGLLGDPITTPDGITYEIDWDDEVEATVPAEDCLRFWERASCSAS